MGGTAKFLVLIAAGCLAGVLLWPAPKAHVPGPAPHAAAIVPAPISGARIWYAAKNMPLLSLPDGRQEIVRSVLNITGPMQFGSFVWNEDRIPEGPLWVRIDLTRQLMSVFRAGHEIGTAVILYGTDGKPTPTGSFSIL
ncbi:MAG: L,D-transpeptidase family protein, partial [Rhizomicrobium sp.]